MRDRFGKGRGELQTYEPSSKPFPPKEVSLACRIFAFRAQDSPAPTAHPPPPKFIVDASQTLTAPSQKGPLGGGRGRVN